MCPDRDLNARPGFFLTFEGLDGSGKTTQIRRLTDTFDSDGTPYLVTRQPGGTAFGDRIRALLLDSKSEGLAPRTELAMMFADRAQAIQEVIAPALAADKLVICDRFTDSTEAYQGGGRNLGSDLVLSLHRLICGDLQPDLTILLLPDLQASLARARRRNTRKSRRGSKKDESRFEAEHDAFFLRVYEKYREIAAREHQRVVIIEGELDVDEVHARVMKAISERLKQWQTQSANSA